MFKCIDGLQGSGKSYYAVAKIKEKKSEYFKVLTNIDSFKFFDNVELLKFNELLDVLGDCQAKYDNEEDDSVLKAILIDKGYISKDKPLLLVIDEAHNFFDKKNDLLTWFITYHRHLYIDVYLITQTYSLIHYSYHKLIQEYIHALPQDRQIFGGKFKYQKHIAVPYNKQFTQAGNEYLKLDKSIFNMYQSGDKVRSKSVIRKYLYYVIALAVGGGFAFYYMIQYFFMPSEPTLEPKKAEVSKIVSVVPPPVKKSELLGLTLLEFTCSVKRCTNKREGINFSLDLLQLLVDESKSKIIKVDRNFKNLSTITVLVSDDFLNFFPKGVSNEKRNSSNSISLF